MLMSGTLCLQCFFLNKSLLAFHLVLFVVVTISMLLKIMKSNFRYFKVKTV